MRKSNHRQPVIHRLTLLMLALLGLTMPLYAREKSDVIVMRNGDRITCEIKELKSNTLYISVDYLLNTQSVNWKKVDHIESKQLFLVTTQDGTVYEGAISTVGTPGKRATKIEVLESPEKKVVLERERVIDVNETSARFWNRFNGEIGLGSSFTKGNESRQFNLNTQLAYAEERWSTSATYVSNLNTSTGASISTRNDFTVSGQRLLRWKNWYYAGVGDFLQSSTQGINLQTTLGGGIGRYIKKTGGMTFNVYGGIAWQQINYEQATFAAGTQNVASALLGANLDMFRFDRTHLSVSAFLLPALSEPGRMHFNLNSIYYVKLWGKLNWNFTFYGNWDNRPPPGFSGTDYGSSSGMSASFGNR
jgi:hypothetical protein